MTVSFYSLLLGIAGIIGTVIRYLPIYGLYQLLVRWDTRKKDEADVQFAAHPNRTTWESDDKDEEAEEDSVCRKQLWEGLSFFCWSMES